MAVEDRSENKNDIKKKPSNLKRHTMPKEYGSNLSFIQLAKEARDPDTDRGLMVGKNFSQQATLICLPLHLSVYPFIQ